MIWYDALIVGRGIAGNTLALTLLEQGASIKVVDSPHPKMASRVAAGLFNPFTGKRTTKTWLAEQLFPFLDDFYTRIERKTNAQFLYHKPIYRPFLSHSDYNDWSARASNEDCSDFVHAEADHGRYSPWIHNPMGGLESKQSGYLDTIAYLDASETLLRKEELLYPERFHYEDLSIQTKGVLWKGMHFRYVIFCEGIMAMQNPYFPKLPMVPNKGEIMTLTIPDYPLQDIISKGVFLLPKKAGVFQLGSTYRWVFEHNEPEERGVEELLGKLKKWFKPAFETLHAEAGVRPASKDRRPLMGFLDSNPALLIFNGLGTKGVSLAPYWAHEMAQFIIHQKDFDPEVDIRRFYVN
jgi:glycine/D-amino acid oxidase-like deaminating enzyme